MGYYIRILGKNPDNVSLNLLRERACPAVLNVSEGSDERWEQLIMTHESGQEIALIGKNLVVDGQLGADELQEFMDEVALLKPESAATWLRQYLPAVKVIYALQLLSGTDADDGRILLRRVYSALWNHAGGILQADGEGFSDEDGFTIVWQFGERVTGPWNMGILRDGRWLHFEMDLGNQQHREAFTRGEVPDGVSPV
jgi:hypothetical protein